MRAIALLLSVSLFCACETDEGTPAPDDLTQEVRVDLQVPDAVADSADGMDGAPDIVDEPVDIALLQFGKLYKWTNPIEDYIALNEEELGHSNFMKSIFDMTVFQDRLYIGYGDANLNLGRNTPIEIRYFTDSSSKEYSFDFTTDEEQIDRYRRFDDLLLIPGVDATEDAFLGNVYSTTLDGEWYKSRTLEGAWHVHDAVAMDGTIYACGSGGTGDDYANSTVHAFVWQSADGGENFTVVTDNEHPNPPGDQRNVHLLPNGGQLYVFGYFTDDTGMTYGTSYVLEGDSLVSWEGIESFFMLDTLALTPDVGLAIGVHIEDPLRQGALLVEAGVGTAIEALQDVTVLDAEPLPDGRAVLLWVEGNVYPLEDKGGWPAHVGVLTTDGTVTEIADFFPTTQPVSVAFWKGLLFVGMADGTIFRAAPETE